MQRTHPASQGQVMTDLDGEAGRAEAASIAAHLEQCRECQDLAADFQSVSRRLLEWQVQESSATAPQIVATPTRRALSERRWMWAVAGLAAVLVVSVFFRTNTVEKGARVFRPAFRSKQFVRDGARMADAPAAIGGVAGDAL